MYGTALQAACHYGYEPTVRTLLEVGADVNLKGGYHGDALQAAARIGPVTSECWGFTVWRLWECLERGERGHQEVVHTLRAAIAKWKK
jgi:hypothetical protein